MRVVVKKRGNSALVRILTVIMEAARLRPGQPVHGREKAGRIVIEPIRDAAYNFSTLVAGITDENRHEAVEMEPPVGEEVW